MTVVDTSCVVDYLVGGAGYARAHAVMHGELPPIGPDILVFETVAALRRMSLRGSLDSDRADGAVEDLGRLRVDLVPSLKLTEDAWRLRHNLDAGDSFFVALAARLGEPLATSDRRMARAARTHAGVETIEL